jgi:hypothetical protein
VGCDAQRGCRRAVLAFALAIQRDAVAGTTREQLDARAIPGKWPSRKVICHIPHHVGAIEEKRRAMG